MTTFLALVAYSVIGAVLVVAVERRTDHELEQEGGSVLVGLCVIAWPITLLVGLLVLIGQLVHHIAGDE